MDNIVLATFVGGPLDGQRRYVERDRWGLEAQTLDRARLASLAPEEALPIISYHYRRTTDWLRDGSVVFSYEPPGRNQGAAVRGGRR